MRYFLGLQIKRDRAQLSLHLCQTQYIDTILARFDMQDCKPAKSPLPPKIVLSIRQPHELRANGDLYLRALGSLMYAMLGTRPDIAFAVGLLSRFSSDPSISHWNALMGVFRYLKHTRTVGIDYNGGNSEIIGYSDADFATSDVDRRRVTSGYVFILWGGPISWCSKRQPSVSLATADAEYVGLAQSGREIMWLRALMTQIGSPPTLPSTIYGDNQASISSAYNPIGHSRSKQIDIIYHYLRELVERDEVVIRYVKTTAMAADGLTKPLPPSVFAQFLRLLNLTPAPIMSCVARVGQYLWGGK